MALSYTAAEIAALLKGEVIGDGTVRLTSFAAADRARAGDLTFAEKDTYFAAAEASAAAALGVVTPSAPSSSNASSKPLPTALHAVAEERNLPTALWEIAGDRMLQAAQRWSDRAAEMAAHATYYGRCDVDVAPMHWQREMASQIGTISNPQALLAICPAKQVMTC